MSTNSSQFPIVPDNWQGSTYLNSAIDSYADLVYYTKSLLGDTIGSNEMSDAQWAVIIDEAITKWTQFGGGMKEEYLVFTSDIYHHGCGVKLDEILSVGCNRQYCYQTLITESVTSTDISYTDLGSSTAYLSVSPFKYPDAYDYLNPFSVPFSGVQGQYMYLYFDPRNPWNATDVCQANCVTLNPLHSRWYEISGNAALSGIHFDFINDSTISNLASSLSAFIPAPLSSVALSALGNYLSAIPVSYYPLSAFYPSDINFGPPLEACVNIGKGVGYVYPDCNTSNIDPCSALSAQYGISPNWCYTTVMSGDIPLYLSGCDGSIFPLTSTDISKATHIKLEGVPRCTLDGSIPLSTNDGILGTFTLCNTALNTNGPMYLEEVQFFKDFKPPEEVLYENRCGWTNSGFTLTTYLSSYSECARFTPTKIPVDVNFSKIIETTNIGTVSSYLSSNFDTGIQRNRKVHGVFSVDPGSQSGYGGFGGDLLFNFDYALMANTFGYDLQGSRTGGTNTGYDLLTYHMAKSFVDHARKVLRNVTYTFDPKTQYLKVIPEPAWGAMADDGGASCAYGYANGYGSGLQGYLLGVYVEPSIEDCLTETWVQDWVLARAMWTLGRIRSKFGGVTLYGGQTITGDQLFSEGQQKMEQLLKELRNDGMWVAPPMFFIG